MGGGSGNDLMYGQDGHDEMYGGTGKDRMYGQNGNDILKGQDGNDQLYGNAGHDQLWGGDGSDYLSGSSGNDVLVGGRGADYMHGGSGRDVFRFESLQDSSLNAVDVIADFTRGQDRIDLAKLNIDFDDLDIEIGGGVTDVEVDGQDFSIRLLGHHNLTEQHFIV